MTTAREALRALVDALPRCTWPRCDAHVTYEDSEGRQRCSEHVLEHAPPQLRRVDYANALLAAQRILAEPEREPDIEALAKVALSAANVAKLRDGDYDGGTLSIAEDVVRAVLAAAGPLPQRPPVDESSSLEEWLEIAADLAERRELPDTAMRLRQMGRLLQLMTKRAREAKRREDG